jgi:hypothetical protein
MSFQSNILIISGILLLFLLIVIAYILYKLKRTTAWPPEVGNCPDYWVQEGNGVCKNVLNLGNGTCEANVNFSGSEWQGEGGLKKKSEWAKNCGVIWDGISGDSYKQFIGSSSETRNQDIDVISAALGLIDNVRNSDNINSMDDINNILNSTINK